MTALRIDAGLAERLFEELRARTADPPGVTRAAYGEGEEIGHAIVRREAAVLGLDSAVDAAGNLYLTLAGRDPTLPGWIVGSHIDSVPHGGNFDGAAGVFAGLCAVEALITAGIRPRRAVTVMVTRAEESTWFPVSYPGSRAAFGRLPPETLELRRADTGRTLREHMAALGLRPEAVAAGEAFLTPERIHGFVELHIEQGPVLEAVGAPLGLVTGIAGSFRYRKARCLGRTGHSGAVPRGHRQDAVVALAELVVGLEAVWDALEAEGEAATITFGEVATDPALHAFSKVPGEVAFCLDVRSVSEACLDRIRDRLTALAGEIEARRGVRFDFGARTGSTPARLDPGLCGRLAAVADAASIAHLAMPSGAGHDTAVFAAAGVPAAMIFVRNQNGSHNPDEAMRIEDFAAGAEVLARLLADDSTRTG
ncbi:Zn-dependent hydrolase [Labrys wisconsinensis]|uniref:N-carbamoyl-L-amino-acid hydrolase n=1 Tax=Labrys wisconsinensis TaxID=425677 RepID=A0ABU0JJX2_9HYPH|nr:Zn-dependent hydrolase [Labrys wisconsinensis]MDQ0474591.1 N-carbamoyl-L-amino-acid hydrolase [Labrys wisconsinensis]